MRIILKRADFSSNNIGVTPTWSIVTILGAGATYSGPNIVDKNSELIASVSVSNDYMIDTDGLTLLMGESNISSTALTINDNIINIHIPSVTGNVSINVPTISTDSTVSTVWYINSLDQIESTGANIVETGVKLTPSSSYAWAFQDTFNNKLVGKTINRLKIFAHTAGVFHIGKFSTVTNSITESRSVNISEINTSIIYTFDDLTISSGEYFVWNNTEDRDNEGELYYFFQKEIDSSKVETSKWYMVSSSLSPFGEHVLVPTISIGYQN